VQPVFRIVFQPRRHKRWRSLVETEQVWFDYERSASMYRALDIATCSLAVMLLSPGGIAIAGPELICEESTYNFGEREVGQSV